MRRLLLTDDKGLATLRAAGIPCEEVVLPGDTASPPPPPPLPPVQMSLQQQPHMRHHRYGGVKFLTLGAKQPAEGDKSMPAWAMRALMDEIKTTGKKIWSRHEVNQFLLVRYQLDHGKMVSGVSGNVTKALDQGWLVPTTYP